MMVFTKVVVIVAVVSVAVALPQYSAAPTAPAAPQYSSAQEDPQSPASYSFSYDANDAPSGNQYGHVEQREGPQSSGEYRVLLPDGRTQVVRYTVEGSSGFVAKVTYEGGAPAAGGSYE